MKNSVRWLPAVIVPALVVGGIIAVPAIANAAGTPPDKTAQEVLTLIAGAKDLAYSGTVEQSSDLGLPQLPKFGPGSSSSSSDPNASLVDLLTADHTARVFADGQTKQRVQVLDTLAERDVVRNGDDVWLYDSKTKTATHRTITAEQADATPTPSPDPSATAEALSPAQLADKIIAAIDPTTKISVTSTATVAGRPVYRLKLTPTSDGTLVASVVLSIDAKTGLPLKVVVDARGQSSDAFVVGFRSIDFSTPSASTFEFTPPPGAQVTTPDAATKGAGEGTQTDQQPLVTGTSWESIVELPAPADGQPIVGGTTDPSQSTLLDELATPVAGGRALQTSLVTVLLLDDGRVFAGAVPLARLEAAAQ